VTNSYAVLAALVLRTNVLGN